MAVDWCFASETERGARPLLLEKENDNTVGEVMDPFRMGLEQAQQMVTLSEQHVQLAKRQAALELAQTESDLALATARVKVAEAELAKLQVLLAAAQDDDAETAHLTALATAVEIERDARIVQVDCLTGNLEIRREMAHLALDIDPSAMGQILGIVAGPDSDNPNSQPH